MDKPNVITPQQAFDAVCVLFGNVKYIKKMEEVNEVLAYFNSDVTYQKCSLHENTVINWPEGQQYWPPINQLVNARRLLLLDTLFGQDAFFSDGLEEMGRCGYVPGKICGYSSLGQGAYQDDKGTWWKECMIKVPEATSHRLDPRYQW